MCDCRWLWLGFRIVGTHFLQFEPSSTCLDNFIVCFGTGTITLNLPVTAKPIGMCSVAGNIWRIWNGEGVQVVVPVPPPMNVLVPLAIVCIHVSITLICRQNTRLFALLWADEMYVGMDGSSALDGVGEPTMSLGSTPSINYVRLAIEFCETATRITIEHDICFVDAR